MSLARLAFALAIAAAGACSSSDVPFVDDDDGDGDGDPLRPDGGVSEVPDVPDAATGDNCDPEGGIEPAPEQPDGLDNDCDGLADEVTACVGGAADFASLATAIEAVPDGGAIEVCPGTYRERLVISRPVTIVGTGGAGATILDAEQEGRAIYVSGTAAGVVLIEGLTVRNGYLAAGDQGAGIRCQGSALVLREVVVAQSAIEGGMGGGLFATGCELLIEGGRFEGNRAGTGGGAFAIDSTGEIRGSEFIANRAGSTGGLGIVGGALAVRDSELRGNTVSVSGGGMHVEGDAQIENNAVLDNEAGWIGGGIYVVGHTVVLRGNTVSNNRSFNDGGGLYSHASDIVVEDNTFVGNTTEDDGGGVRIFSEVAPGADLPPLHCRVTGNTIEGNHAGDSGGGVRVSHEPCLLVDNVVRGNSAGNRGGGMDLDNDASVVRGGLVENNTSGSVAGGIAYGLSPWLGGSIEGVTFRGNEAGSGGALLVDDNFQDVALSGLLFENNRASRGAAIYSRASDVTLRHSVLRGNVATSGGGGLFVAIPPPWDDPNLCCPPTMPVVDVQFSVLYANQAPTGSAVTLEVPGVTVANSILAGHAGGAVAVGPGATPTWRYNATSPAAFVGMADPSGQNGNLNSDPAFVAPASGDFHLGAASPARDAGDPAMTDGDGSRADMGRYGGMAP